MKCDCHQPLKICLLSVFGPFLFGTANAAEKDVTLLGKHELIDNYEGALDHLTREFLFLLEKEKLLVVWCFDQSESMKDDQAEIRARIERVYEELALVEKGKDKLLSSVVSYGDRFFSHTRKPTGDVEQIRRAIDTIPVDPTGHERMCQAVCRAITMHRMHAKGEDRKLVLILVTDESGDRKGNADNLERAIKEAKAAKCRVYVLGREAVFGYPYAHFRWVHPQTKLTHWLRIDRGPETAFVQQLQTDGFGRRRDALSSGFGPYELTRLVRETDGIFYTLPSVESALGDSRKQRYKLEDMICYRPDLRPRTEVIADREKNRLQSTMFKLIQQLDPNDMNATKLRVLQTDFKDDDQIKAALMTATHNEQVFKESAELLGGLQKDRAAEPSPRWQANYDLMIAELAVFQARTIEYRAALQQFIEDPKKAPPTDRGLKFQAWKVTVRKETIAGELSRPLVEDANKLLQVVVEKHPGTPWAVRADWERKRGYGIDLRPHYDRDPVKVPSKLRPPNL